MKNTLMDLHNILFAQLETLSDEDLKGDKLKQEIERSKAMSSISSTIVKNAGMVLKGAKEAGNNRAEQVPDFITGKKKDPLLEWRCRDD